MLNLRIYMMFAPLKWDESKENTNKTNILYFGRTTCRKIYGHMSVTAIAKSIPLQIK